MAEKQQNFIPVQQAMQPTPESSYSATPPIPPPSQSPEWSHSFWDCYSPMEICLCGWCGPCCLYGKTQSRLEDPALKNHPYVNGDCCLYTVLGYTCFSWVLLMLKRGELRQRFGIQGSGMGDCAAAYFCPCCTLVQQEKEVEARSNQVNTGYQPPEGMVFGSK